MPDISEDDYASLCARSARIHQGRASLQIQRMPINGAADGATEKRFVMQGPSGTHTLLVDATDRERLNAHWRGFSNDIRNRYTK